MTLKEGAPLSRVCTKCHTEKPLTEFTPHARGKFGRQASCQECNRIASKARYWKDRETTRANDAEYRRRLLAEDPDRGKAAKRAWAAANRDRLKAYRRRWAENNPERHRAAQAKWAAANRATAARTWAQENPERDRELKRRWALANPESRRAAIARRRAKVKAVGGSYTPEDVAALKVAQRGRCACCREKLPKRFHVDHITPIKRGGTNDRKNIQLLCPPCNHRKSAKDPIDFMQERGFLI